MLGIFARELSTNQGDSEQIRRNRYSGGLDLSDFSSLGLLSLTVFSICGFTDVASNTAVPRARECQISLSLVSDGIVYFTSLQQIIFNAGRAIIEKMLRDPGRSTQTSSSSQDLTCIPQWMGEDAFDGHCSHPPGERSIVCLYVRRDAS